MCGPRRDVATARPLAPALAEATREPLEGAIQNALKGCLGQVAFGYREDGLG